MTPDDIKEGDDVYFECHVQSNPPWRKLLWLHNVSVNVYFNEIEYVLHTLGMQKGHTYAYKCVTVFFIF